MSKLPFGGWPRSITPTRIPTIPRRKIGSRRSTSRTRSCPTPISAALTIATGHPRFARAAARGAGGGVGGRRVLGEGREIAGARAGAVGGGAAVGAEEGREGKGGRGGRVKD